MVTGRQLGIYQIQTLLGAGGMGEVYRARDTKLGRDVAIKILPAGVASHPDRLLRFEREARVLATLNHPHVGAIYGLEESDGVRALVLELIEGPTLAERLSRGPIPAAEAVAIARQIADALDAAHERGIVHRDLKPSNIKIAPGGVVKVLDFGLAKAVESDDTPDLSRSPTVTVQGTRDGVILGTAAYMSPEQARGEAVDARADIWAFGCVLYEMLTGTRAFAGDNVSDTLASVLRSEPDFTALSPDAAPLATLLKRCLEKDVRRRIRAAADVMLWLDDATGGATSLRSGGIRGERFWWVAVAAALGVAVGTLVTTLRPRAGPAPSPLSRFELAAPATDPFDFNAFGSNVAISPDGTRIVFTATRRGVTELVVRRLDQLTSSPIPGTEGAFGPFFSADGRQVGFFAVGELKRIPVDGGSAVAVCKIDPIVNGATWGADNEIVFSQDGRLFRVRASGGEPQEVASPDPAREEAAYTYPTLAGARVLLYTIRLRNRRSLVVARREMGRGAPTTIADGGFGAQYLSPDLLLYAQEGRLMAVRFDPAAPAAVGSPVTVLDGVATKFSDGLSNVAVSDNGTMAYVSGPSGVSPGRLVWIDRRGARIASVSDQPLPSPRNMRLSPDGRRLVVAMGPSGIGDIWIFDLTGAAQPLKLTFRDHNTFPIWAPDGKRIAFVTIAGSATRALFSLPADGSMVQSERLTAASGDEGMPTSWSMDGSTLLVHRDGLWTLRLKDGVATPWLQTPFAQFSGALSPNGRWVAYASAQTGSVEVWVRPFPGPGAPVRVSADGGHDPVWSRDGTELFYDNGPRLKSARVVADAGVFRAEAPRTLFEGGFAYDETDPNLRLFDVAPDGRFLMVERVAQSAAIVVAQHADEEVRRLLQAK